MNRRAAFLLTFAATLCLSGAALAKSDSIVVQTTFDSDLGGWTSNTPAEVAWNASGGNPGGEALFTDATGSNTYIAAPSQFLSPAVDYTKLDGKAYISYQHLMVKETGIEQTDTYTLTLSGPGGVATFNGGLATVLDKKNKWTTFVAPLVEADWKMTTGTWSALLANVTSLQVPMELVSNSSGATDQEAVDNIMIVSHPSGFSVK